MAALVTFSSWPLRRRALSARPFIRVLQRRTGAGGGTRGIESRDSTRHSTAGHDVAEPLVVRTWERAQITAVDLSCVERGEERPIASSRCGVVFMQLA